MTVSHTYLATGTWTAVENGDGDITDGVFSVVNKSEANIQIKIATSTPTSSSGDDSINTKGDSVKVELKPLEFLYVKSSQSQSGIGVFTA